MYLRIILLFSLFLTSGLYSAGQEYRETIRRDPARAASNLYGYEYVETEHTDPPAGFRPFYINHYGRHGSRYMSSGVESDAVREVFTAADSCGLLTDAGKLFWKDLKAVLDEQEGVVGMLTSKGAREQYGIGSRMARRFPEIFKGRSGRNKVDCISSTSPRCLVSMTCFTDGLERHSRGLEISYATGDKYYAYLAYHPPVQEGLNLSGDLEMEFRRAESRPQELFRHFFTEPDSLGHLIGDPYRFERRLYQFCCVGHLTDYGECLLEHFPYECLVKNQEARNARFYVAYANSKELPHYASDVAGPLLEEIIGAIDEALEEDSDVAADLCFGHDVTLMPLLSHIGIEGMHERLSFDEVNGRWDSADFINMGANLQLVFYRNGSGEVLVKLLHNEKETTIPALKPYHGPYYSWSALRAYLLSL